MPEQFIAILNKILIFDLIFIVLIILSLIKCTSKGFVLSLLYVSRWLVGYILTLLIAKLFGAEGLGEYVLAVTVLRLFVLIAKLGFDTTSIRFLASFVIQKKWDSIHFFRRKVIFILIITSIISSICMYLFSEDLGLLLSLDYKYIRLNSFFVLPMVFFMLHYQSLRGLKRIGDFSFSSSL